MSSCACPRRAPAARSLPAVDEPPAAPSQQRSASLLETVATLAILLGAAPVLVSCDPGLTDPALPHDPDPYALQEIRMRVTEGLPEVDYTVVLDGSTRVLWGLHCAKGCDFQGGEVLRSLHLKQVQYLTALFVEAEVQGLKEADFGPGCRDEFYVEVIYRYEGGEGSFRGCITRFPKELEVAVGVLLGIVDGTLPLLVDFNAQPHLWPQDPFSTLDASVSPGGDVLRVQVRYGGGCTSHEFQLVAWEGWVEAEPVQVRVFLSHDSFGDPCRALITEDRRFDLGPLKRAYREKYGPAAPGVTTLVIVLENHTVDGRPLQRSLEYQF